MPQDEHPGFDFWDERDPDHPFPVGDIDLDVEAADCTSGSADLELPQGLPTGATVAERSIGVVGSGQLWFALECVKDLQGGIRCEGVMRGRHAHWYPEHGEKDAGPVLEVRLSMAELGGFGRKEALGAHGQHCDLFAVTWHQRHGKVHVELYLLHVTRSVAQFLADRERWKREAERMPPWRPSVVVPEVPRETPPPAPPPKPEPGPDGAMLPERPKGLLALLRRIGKALFG